jgi:hypothetical protein
VKWAVIQLRENFKWKCPFNFNGENFECGVVNEEK